MGENRLLFRSPAICLTVTAALLSLQIPGILALPLELETSAAAPLTRSLQNSPPSYNLDGVTALFAQVAVGGGYTTIFALLNTGDTDLNGRLVLTDTEGNPMKVALSSPPADPGDIPPGAPTDSMNILIPRGGTRFIAAEPPGALTGTRTGWARVESTGGRLGGAATFQFVEAGELKTIAGVLAADAVEVATIPVNNDDIRNRYTGYAIANPSATDINIKIVVLDESGSTVETLILPSLNPLGPGKQIARFLHQDSQRLKFKGSMVLLADTGKRVSVVALVLEQGLLTAIPVIPAKAPHVN